MFSQHVLFFFGNAFSQFYSFPTFKNNLESSPVEARSESQYRRAIPPHVLVFISIISRVCFHLSGTMSSRTSEKRPAKWNTVQSSRVCERETQSTNSCRLIGQRDPARIGAWAACHLSSPPHMRCQVLSAVVVFIEPLMSHHVRRNSA